MCNKALQILGLLLLGCGTASGEGPVCDDSVISGSAAGLAPTRRIHGLRVERLLDENGAMIDGVPTRHYWYRTTYTVLQDDSSFATDYELLDDIWAATASEAVGRPVPDMVSTGDPCIEALIAAEQGRAGAGVALRQTRAIRTSTRQLDAVIEAHGVSVNALTCAPSSRRLARTRRALYRR